MDVNNIKKECFAVCDHDAGFYSGESEYGGEAEKQTNVVEEQQNITKPYMQHSWNKDRDLDYKATITHDKTVHRYMSRQRRIAANARERSRVHSISTAYENLRKVIPTYSDKQKLSKLAIIQVASAYILNLKRMSNKMSNSHTNTSDNHLVALTSTILNENKFRKKISET